MAQISTDSTTKHKSIKAFFKAGEFNGRSRLYFMATDNQKGFSDYQGLGFGAGLNYESPEIKGFSVAMGGYFILNLLGDDVAKVDSLTQSPSRYELGLFDIENPTNPNLVRLENLSLKYRYKNSNIQFGRYTPTFSFLNGQDGRMTPTMVKGLKVFSQPVKKLTFELNYISKISPRSSLGWYSIAESMSLYPSGRSEEGTKSNYTSGITAKGILIGTAKYTVNKKLSLYSENYFIKDLYNLYHLQADYKSKTWYLGTMFTFQEAKEKSNGQNFINHDAIVSSNIIGRQFYKNNVSLAYTRIGKSGRFLFPREWGREPFYTFMPRERNEGNGDVNAIKVAYQRIIDRTKNIELSYGRFYLTSPSQPILNKYGMPSYDQLNITFKHKLTKQLDGFDYQILFIRKSDLVIDTLEPKYIFNKVNLNLLNIIINFKF